jgi:hypothetical protein
MKRDHDNDDDGAQIAERDIDTRGHGAPHQPDDLLRSWNRYW